MKTIFVRSPYFIEVNETPQAESKLELFLWNKGETEPTLPTYTLSKKAPSTTQTANVYNISNYAKEFIDIVNPTFIATPIEEENNNWCYIKVKRYSAFPSGTYTLLDTTTYIGLNGYASYIGGYNQDYNVDFLPLSILSETEKYKFYKTAASTKPYLNFYIDYTDDTDVYKVRYSSGAYSTNVDILNGDVETQYVFKIPITQLDANFDNGKYLKK